MSRRKIKRAGYQVERFLNQVLEYIIKVWLCVDEGVLTFRFLHIIILVLVDGWIITITTDTNGS